MSEKIRFDGKEFEINTLSKIAKETYLSMQFAEDKLKELHNLKAIFQRATNSYVESLKKEVISKKAGLILDND